jgi:flagellar biosynthesis protein FlhA
MHQGADRKIPVVTLDVPVERTLLNAVQHTEHGSFLAVEPPVAEKIINRLTALVQKFTSLDHRPIVLCSSRIRTHFRKLVERFIPDLVVLSYEEILSHVEIQSLGTVELTDAD